MDVVPSIPPLFAKQCTAAVKECDDGDHACAIAADRAGLVRISWYHGRDTYCARDAVSTVPTVSALALLLACMAIGTALWALRRRRRRRAAGRA